MVIDPQGILNVPGYTRTDKGVVPFLLILIFWLFIFILESKPRVSNQASLRKRLDR